ncbi:MAG: helix-turn-helix domain-containing protein [Candidatus Micrarchaeota archaeon]
MVVKAFSAEAFCELGLTSTEAKLLDRLARAGHASGSALAASLGMHKSAAYFCLERLVSKGFASRIVVNGVRDYRALAPEALAEAIARRKTEFSERVSALGALLAVQARKEQGSCVRIFSGWDGLRLAFGDILKLGRGEEYLVFAVDTPDAVFPRFRRFIRQFHARRAAKGISCSILVSSKLRGSIGADRRREAFTQVRFVSSEHAMPMAANVYGGKVLLAVWGDAPVGIVIENAGVAESFKAFFRLLWRVGRP